MCFGLPQSRERLYIVGVRRGYCPGGPPLKVPAGTALAITLPKITDFLGNPSPVPRRSRCLPTQITAKKNLLLAQSNLRKSGIAPSATDAVVDLGSGRGLNMRINVCPTITRCRGGARDFWVTSLGRRLSAWELLRLQGALLDDLDFSCVSEREVGLMAGNAMSATLPAHPLSFAHCVLAAGVVLWLAAWADYMGLRCPCSRRTSGRLCGAQGWCGRPTDGERRPAQVPVSLVACLGGLGGGVQYGGQCARPTLCAVAHHQASWGRRLPGQAEQSHALGRTRRGLRWQRWWVDGCRG